MTAPMDLDHEYKLNIEIEQVSGNEVFLRVEKEFTYDDIWKARDEYDKFFVRADYYDYEFCTNKLPVYDKWINMIGNEECMVVKKVYVLKFNSLVEAKKEKNRLEKEHDKIIRNNRVIESEEIIRGAVVMNPILEEENEASEKIYPGHEKCEQLRKIRIKIAEVNNIKFEPTICTHKGPCLGTCPVCDSEIRYLDSELQKKKVRGEEIILAGIAEDEIKEAKVNVPEDEEIIEMGMPIAKGGLEFNFALEDIQDEW